MRKIALTLIFALVTVQSAFSLSGYMKDSILQVKGSVKDFSDIGIKETFENGRAVKSNPLDLQVGDIFIDVNGIAQKVIKITKSGKSISIETESPEISEIFEYINIPDQTIDFTAYEDEYQSTSYVTDVNPSRSANNSRMVSDTLLDTLMPEGSRSYNVSLTFSHDIKDWTKNSQSLIEKFEKTVEDGLVSDKKGEQDIYNFTQQLRNKNTNNNVSVGVTITAGVRFKNLANLLDYGFSWVPPTPHVLDWPWNWGINPGGGHVRLDYENTSDLGLEIDVYGYINDTLSAPIPGLAYGSPKNGPYAGLYFDLSATAGINLGYNYYKHFDVKAKCYKEFTGTFGSKGSPIQYTNVWAPSAHQFYALASGEVTFGPSIKVGFVALGKKLVEAHIDAGGYIDGKFGFAGTIIDLDERGYDERYTINGSPERRWVQHAIENKQIFHEFNDDTGKWSLKVPEGSTSIGSFSLGAFARGVIDIWGGMWNLTPLDYKMPILTQDGWKDEWEIEGSDWFTGDH